MLFWDLHISHTMLANRPEDPLKLVTGKQRGLMTQLLLMHEGDTVSVKAKEQLIERLMGEYIKSAMDK